MKVLTTLHPLPFPVVFPEVFLRERAGFDVLLGNPPWAKARLEELKFWGRHKPGIRGLSTTARNEAVAELVRSRPDLVRILEREKALLEGIRHAVRHMPGMNTGHPDYFRAFLQRYIQLIYENGGQLGIVLPGDAFKIRGATKLRGLMAKKFGTARIQLLTNKSWWVFDEVDGRKLIALLSARSSHDSHCLYAFPPEFHSMESWVKDAPAEGMSVYDDWLTDYSSNRVVPTMPSGTNCFETSRVLSVFMRHEPLRSHKTFKLVRVYADFETKRDNRYWKDHGGDADWPVYKGSSFDIWAPETGRNFAWCDGNNILVKAQERRLRSATYSRFPRDWLADIQTHPVLAPRIAFRDVTNRTNTRTFVTALIPGNRVLTQAAPWVLFLNPYEKSRHEAALLGILSSIPLDWWVRRFVEGHVDEEAFMSLRIPEFNPQQRVWHRTIHLAGRLASPDNRFAGWAKEVGVTHGPLDADEKQEMIHELDAVVACLYGLNQKHLIHIFETFHEGWDYHARLDATLGHFRAWKKRAKS
ncbi:hypothetical protein H8E52_09430 [bacterium]|nr:hypothetical protein [bacterium]